jgi:NarL family two-component system sensor histidine kinase YdfH
LRLYQESSTDVIIDPAVFLFVGGVASFVVLYIQRAQAHERSQALLNDLEGAHAQLAGSAARIEELTLLAERRRIARELHDTVTQGLAGVIMQLEAADGRLADQHPARAREIVQQAMVRARAAFTAARCAIDNLRDEAVESANPLTAAQEEIARFASATGIVCSSDLACLAQLPWPLHDPIRRVIGEGLTNIARHAGAGHAWIRAARCERAVEVEIRDDGVGFDPSAVAARGHYGLLGLRERARLVGGVLEVTSKPGQGTTLRLVLPCTSVAEDVHQTGGEECSPAALL